VLEKSVQSRVWCVGEVKQDDKKSAEQSGVGNEKNQNYKKK